MVDPTTTNRSFAIPTHGSDVDTWDQPLNANSALLDTILGGQGTVAATSGGTVVLNAAQLAFGLITVTGVIAANATIRFPAIQGWWSINNTTTGAGNLIIDSVGTTQSIGIPPGQITDIQVIGTVVKFRNLPCIGSFMDYPSATVPGWITVCTIPPYLLCDGTTFSTVTYPYLNTILGGNTLPDLRGRSVYYLNGAATTRLTLAGAGIDGNTLGATGGNNGVMLAANQVPSIGGSANVNSTTSGVVVVTSYSNFSYDAGSQPGGLLPIAGGGGSTATINSTGSFTYTNGTQVIIGNAAPGIVLGIRMIRAG